ncbi:MAG: hypothetical protein NC093_07180 [Alistipes sp.]|nr:hypothetical protein [Alistipes sp.]
MNKKTLALIAFGSFAGIALRSQSKRQQAKRYIEAITEILDNKEVTDFESFSDYLLEYYGITAKNICGNVVEYSAKQNSAMISEDLRKYGSSGYGYDMGELETFFSSNRMLV